MKLLAATLMIYDFIWRDCSDTGVHDDYYGDNLKFKKFISSPSFTNSSEYAETSADQEIPAVTYGAYINFGEWQRIECRFLAPVQSIASSQFLERLLQVYDIVWR